MKNIFLKNLKFVVLIVFIVAFAIVIPLTSSGYQMMVVDVALLYFVAALGLSLLQGMGGMMSLAQVSFMGIGAFSTAQLSKNFGLPTLLSVILAVFISALVSLIMGAILLRLKGSYFVFATMGLMQILANIFLNYKPLTGGPDGMSNIPSLDLGPLSPGSDRNKWFYILLVVAFICGVFIENIRCTHLGRALSSVRDNEIAAMSLGINVYFTRLVAFIIAGSLAGFSGALYAHYSTFVSHSLFSQTTGTLFLMMIMLGGVNSTVGTFVGALLVTMLPEWMRPLKEYLMLIYGLGIILMMLFMPMGLAGLFQSIIKTIKSRFPKEVSTDELSGTATEE